MTLTGLAVTIILVSLRGQLSLKEMYTLDALVRAGPVISLAGLGSSLAYPNLPPGV